MKLEIELQSIIKFYIFYGKFCLAIHQLQLNMISNNTYIVVYVACVQLTILLCNVGAFLFYIRLRRWLAARWPATWTTIPSVEPMVKLMAMNVSWQARLALPGLIWRFPSRVSTQFMLYNLFWNEFPFLNLWLFHTILPWEHVLCLMFNARNVADVHLSTHSSTIY